MYVSRFHVRTIRNFRVFLAVVLQAALSLQFLSVAHGADTARSSSQAPPFEIVTPPPMWSFGGTAISADGRFMAISFGTGAAVWDLTRGRMIRMFSGLSDSSGRVALTPDATKLAAIGRNQILVWNTKSGKALASYTDPALEYFNDIAITPDGQSIIIVGSPKPCVFSSSCKTGYPINNIIIFNINSAKVVRLKTKYSSPFYSIAISRTKTIAVSIGDGAIASFDASGNFMWEQRGLESGSGIAAVTVKSSPDGQILATVGRSGLITLMNASTGSIIAQSSSPLSSSEPYLLSWANDGLDLAVLSFGMLRLLAAADLRERWSRKSEDAKGRSVEGERVTFVDNTKLALVRTGIQNGIHIKRRENGETIDVIEWKGVFAPEVLENQNGFTSKILTRAEDGIQVWSFDDGAFGSSGFGGSKVLGGTIVIDVDRGEFIAFTKSHLSSGKYNLSYFSSFNTPSERIIIKDGQLENIESGGRYIGVRRDTKIQVYDVETSERVSTIESPNGGYCYAAKISETGNFVVAHFGDNIAVYALPGGELKYSLPVAFSIGDMRISPDASSLLLAGTSLSRYEVQLWRLASQPKMVRSFSVETKTIVSSAAFSPDGSKFATGSHDGIVRVWNAATGKLLGSFRGANGVSTVLGFSSDGKRLLTSSDVGLGLWSVDAGALLATGHVDQSGGWLTITPEGFFNGTREAAQNLTLVQGLESSSIDRVYDALYRPDLVREKLAGDPRGLVKEAAAKLDLDKVQASGFAPKVGIKSPLPYSDVATGEITAEGEVTDQGGGAGRVEWKVNGVTQGVSGGRGPEQAAPAAASTDGKITKLSQVLSLEPGENVIELTVYNAANLIASEPASVKVTLAGTETASVPKLYVLAIGINDYLDSRMQLNYSVPDAKQLSAALQKAGAGYYESVEAVTLTDAQVTAQGLDQTFSELSRKISPRDVLVFYAAGHGKTMDGRYYYLPHDFRYQTEASIAQNGIGQEQWQAWFAKIPARKSILIYDTCESGTLTLSGEQKVAALTRSGLEQQAALGRLINATGRTVLTAATSDKPALEGYKGHGVFTYALLDGIARSDRNGNGLIEVTELAGFVDETVPQITDKAFGMRQFPQMSVQGSDFALVKKAEGLVEAPEAAVPVTVPQKPTHVVLELVKVFKQAGGSGDVVLELPPASTFAIVRTENGWSLIAKDGKELGFVEEAKATKLQ